MVSPITFRMDEQRKVFVEHEWPMFALVAMAVCNSGVIGTGVEPTISLLDDYRAIRIRCANGEALYLIKSICSDGNYVCELVRASREKAAA